MKWYIYIASFSDHISSTCLQTHILDFFRYKFMNFSQRLGLLLRNGSWKQYISNRIRSNLTSSISVAQVRKAPDVTQAHSIAQASEEVLYFAPPCFTVSSPARVTSSTPVWYRSWLLLWTGESMGMKTHGFNIMWLYKCALWLLVQCPLVIKIYMYSDLGFDSLND